ncbi:NUDIX hydrolase domain-like protein [Schizophyllum commune]
MSGQPEPQVRVGVGAFVTNQSGQFIVGKRKGSHGAGTYALPGGHLEYGESFEACATREVLEETGLEIADITFLTATNDIMAAENKHYVTVFVRGRVAGERTEPQHNVNECSSQVLEPEKCEGWEWVAWDQLRDWITRSENLTCSADRRAFFLPLRNLVAQRPDFTPV